MAAAVTATVGTLLLAGRGGRGRRRRGALCRRRGPSGHSHRVGLRVVEADREPPAGGSSAEVPGDLYELLGVDSKVEAAELKKAYYDKMKVCHPDVAGEDGEEMCILLNDAYDTLSDPNSRAAYDEAARIGRSLPQAGITKFDPRDPVNYEPTWKTKPKVRMRSAPSYQGKPYSRSLWSRLDPAERGQKWSSQQFVFVDEWSCIACRNCCDVAPRTFCIDIEAGRARVFAQWGNSEEDLEYAVAACPVNCIHWVGREDLQVLEFVTRKKLFENGHQLPCPMAARQGVMTADMEDPFALAGEFTQKMKDKFGRAQRAANGKGLGDLAAASAAKVQERIREAFTRLTSALREAGWGK